MILFEAAAERGSEISAGAETCACHRWQALCAHGKIRFTSSESCLIDR